MSSQQTDYERLIRPLEDRMIRSVWRIVSDAEDFDVDLEASLFSTAVPDGYTLSE